MYWTERRERYRALIAGDKCVHPGSVYDAISSRIAEDLGFEEEEARALAPRVGGEPRLHGETAQRRLEVPALLGRDLRQEGRAPPGLLEDDAVASQLDGLPAARGLGRAEHRDVDVDTIEQRSVGPKETEIG